MQLGRLPSALRMEGEQPKSALSEAEMVKLQAEKAALESEKQELDLLKMKLQLEKELLGLETGSANSEDIAVGPSPAPLSYRIVNPAPAEAPAAEVGTPGVSPASAAAVSISIKKPPTSMRQPGEKWSEPKYKYHRFVETDPNGFFPTRGRFQGSKKEGEYEGTYQVQFTPIGKGAQGKTIEFLKTTRGNPSFGVIKVKTRDFMASAASPREEKIDGSLSQFVDTYNFDPETTHLVVRQVNAADPYGLDVRNGDIIRAVSIPVTDTDTEFGQKMSEVEDSGFFGQIGTNLFKSWVGNLPEDEQGIFMCVGKRGLLDQFSAVLKESLRVNGPDGEFIVVLERPGGND